MHSENLSQVVELIGQDVREILQRLNAAQPSAGGADYQRIGNFDIYKYPDGQMIQFYSFEQTNFGDFREKSFNWAVAFAGTPLIFSAVTTSYNGSDVCCLNVSSRSNHTVCYYYEFKYQFVQHGRCRIQFYAVGRWK